MPALDTPNVFGAGWLWDRAAEQVGGEGGPLNIMYRVDGSDLNEESLEHWSDCRGSRPARIGNGTCDRPQLDAYGEAIDSILFADGRGLLVGHRDEPNTVLPLFSSAIQVSSRAFAGRLWSR